MTDAKNDMIFDMVEDMKNDALQQVKIYYYKFFNKILKAKTAVELHKIESKISQHIKNHFDSKYGPSWHCIVGIYSIHLPSKLKISLTR